LVPAFIVSVVQLQGDQRRYTIINVIFAVRVPIVYRSRRTRSSGSSSSVARTRNGRRQVDGCSADIGHLLDESPFVSVESRRRAALLLVQRLTPLVQPRQLHSVLDLCLYVPRTVGHQQLLTKAIIAMSLLSVPAAETD